MREYLFITRLFFCFIFIFFGCDIKSDENQTVVVVYTSLDQVFSEPIIKAFEKNSGNKVKVVYDSEATKTTGLVNRLIVEKDNPQADVFWNSETGRTIVLKKKGVLAQYISPTGVDIPDYFRGSEGYWAGFAARCRILIYNTTLLKQKELPKSILELVERKWRGKVAVAYPLFGTTATHFSALYAHLGKEKAEMFFQALKENDVLITDGNASVRDRVADGTVPIGFTDTDDAFVAIKQGKPVDIIWPDKEGMGTLLIPNTVALIKGGPNPENGKKLIDYLLSPEVEEMLSYSDSSQIPLRPNVKRPTHVPNLVDISAMEVDYEKVAEVMEPVGRYLQTLFIR